MKDINKNWFSEARYGLFIHWGLYAVLAGEYQGKRTDHIAEWIMHYMDIPAEEYRHLAESFGGEAFSAREIVRKAKEDWGMKYLVFTTKHHEGFAMWNSQCSDYNVVKASPYGKDILKEFQEACDEYGIRLGLYYSQAQDWDDPDGYRYGADNSRKNFRRYLDEKCIPQLRELLTGYGEISLLWFDTPMEMTREESKELIDLVNTYQPHCVISGRIGNELGDYLTTGDNFIPVMPLKREWEVPATLNDTWGYNRHDQNWKKPEEILKLLLKIVGRGGNYLLNIGPDGRGRVPEESIQILDEVGRYVRENADGIYGTRKMDLYPYDLEWAQLTAKDYKLFVHVLKPRMRIELLNMANGVKRAYLVKNGQELICRSRNICEGDPMVEVELTEELRQQAYYAVCIELEEKEPIFEPIRG